MNSRIRPGPGVERDRGYKQYLERIGELVSGDIKRFERGEIIVDLGSTEGIVPLSQHVRDEPLSQGGRIRAVVTAVNEQSKGPKVILSRIAPELLPPLFEAEVPEIDDGKVVIKSVARQAGERAKIAVMSNEPGLDPVAACVGVKGSRVQAVVRKLSGEKIDIVEWSADPSVFAANALTPAKVNRVRILHGGDVLHMEAIVDADEVAFAKGKGDQNVQLASELVGGRIDVRSEEEVADQPDTSQN